MSKATKPRSGSLTSSRRRQELRRNLPKPAFDFRALMQRPEFFNVAIVALAFLATSSVLVIWSRDQVKVVHGQIMTDTRLTRLDYEVQDEVRTEQARRAARARAPHVWVPKMDEIEDFRRPLLNLPRIVAGQSSVEEIEETIRQRFDLDTAALKALQPFADDGRPTQQWERWVANLLDYELLVHPIVELTAWQQEQDRISLPLVRVLGDLDVRWKDAIQIRSGGLNDLRSELKQVAQAAGFPTRVSKYIAARLTVDPKPTFVKDDAESDRLADQAERGVAAVREEHRRDEIIYRPGDKLSLERFHELERESQEYRRAASFAAIWLPRVGMMGLLAIVSMFLGGYLTIFYPRVSRNGLRVAAIAALMIGMLAITVLLTEAFPKLLYPAAVAPTLLGAIVLLLAYDQRLAAFLSALQCLLVTLALEQGVGMLILLLAGCGVAIAQLREVRHRQGLIGATTVTALVIGGGTVLLGLMQFPLDPDIARGVWAQIAKNAASAGVASFSVGFVVLGLMPSIERMFDITTGMTLAELRDPKQPLLRQLQQKAPGTYNHSLQVANIAEAAAEAIGANGLLVYVGALYHDIGKMNKPEYFVENQTDGYNKHDKLTPPMSLLVIVGHVKDGVELAREYSLPRQLQHFIESHHGTTLVEYFYHAAVTKASEDEKASVNEVEFRYSGPKPQTREAAILMLADAVESATRAMTEPNPARIEALVRELSAKRLGDGQFNQCDLTFRELGLIEESVITRVCAIHHARISYPSGKSEASESPSSSRPSPPKAVPA